MKIPVWSSDTGTDLRDSENVIGDAMRGCLTRTAVWWDQTRPVLVPNRITHVLDFGPGAGVASLTQRPQYLEDVNCTFRFNAKDAH